MHFRGDLHISFFGYTYPNSQVPTFHLKRLNVFVNNSAFALLEVIWVPVNTRCIASEALTLDFHFRCNCISVM